MNTDQHFCGGRLLASLSDFVRSSKGVIPVQCSVKHLRTLHLEADGLGVPASLDPRRGWEQWRFAQCGRATHGTAGANPLVGLPTGCTKESFKSRAPPSFPGLAARHQLKTEISRSNRNKQ